MVVFIPPPRLAVRPEDLAEARMPLGRPGQKARHFLVEHSATRSNRTDGSVGGMEGEEAGLALGRLVFVPYRCAHRDPGRAPDEGFFQTLPEEDVRLRGAQLNDPR